MRSRFSLLLIALFLTIAVAGCDSGGNDGCTEIINDNNFMLAFQGCPNNGIKEVCNSFACEFTQQIGGIPAPPDAFAEINGMDCSRIDRCTNLDCDLLDDQGQVVGEAIISTIEILVGNSFTGFANLNGSGPFDFTCDIILP